MFESDRQIPKRNSSSKGKYSNSAKHLLVEVDPKTVRCVKKYAEFFTDLSAQVYELK